MYVLTTAGAQNPWWRAGRDIHRPYPQRRDLHAKLCGQLADLARLRATLLLGPRQVGKSVLLRQVAEHFLDQGWPPANITYFDFSDWRIQGVRPSVELQHVAALEPDGTRRDVPRLLLFDEIHSARNWPSWLKQAVDEDRRQPRSSLRILATDSAASALRRGSQESGQGRWSEERIFGLTFPEYVRFLGRPDEPEDEILRRSPDPLESYLAKGGFPEHVSMEPSEEQRRRIREDIVDRAIRRDIASVRGSLKKSERLDIERLTSLFVYLAQESGSVFKISNRAQDLDAHRTTVASWVRMLEDACLIHRVEPFHPRGGRSGAKASRRLATKPKLYVYEHGLIPALDLSSAPMEEPRVRANVTEAVVLRHILELVSRRENVRYFRRRDGLEIDFVFEIDGHRQAVEVTSSTSPAGKDPQRLLTAAGEVGAEQATLIHSGRESRLEGEVRQMPLLSFLRRPHSLMEGMP